MYSIPKNELEADKLLENLKIINGKDLNKDDCEILIEVFNSTPYLGLRDLIGIKLIDAENEALYPYLIKKIKEYIHTKYVSTLIYCCSYYDCSEDIQLFIDIVILKSDMSLADAIGVIRNMESIAEEEKIYAINKLTLYLEGLDNNSTKYRDVNAVINFLNKFP